jgi:xylulokinase
MPGSDDLLLGIDVGTQGVKGMLTNARGQAFAQAHVEHGSIYPRPDWCEQDMLTNWWLNPVAIIRNLLAVDGIRKEQIKAVGISGLYPALGPTDGQGNPLYGAILYSDNRAIAEVEEVNQACGLQLTSEELTPKLIWFLRNEPDLAAKMKMFFVSHNYLVYKLCGEYVTDTVTTGLYGAIYESPTASWRADVCERFGIPINILPKVLPPARIAGKVHAEAAQATGLLEGTPILPGMPDLMASLISAGTVRTYETAAYYGTAGLVPVMKDDFINAAWKPYPISERGLSHQDGYIFDYPAYCLSVGDSARWFRDTFGQLELQAEQDVPGSPNAYVALNALAEEVPAGSEGLLFLPYLQGQRSPDFNPYASGVFFGINKTHTRAHFYRAILESFGYTIRHGFKNFYPDGHPIKRLVATGGGARGTIWRQIVSDITGIRQEYVPDAEGPMGNAYMAGLALGWFEDFDVLQKDWVEVTAVTDPDPGAQATYDEHFATYLQLHEALDPMFSHKNQSQYTFGGE